MLFNWFYGKAKAKEATAQAKDGEVSALQKGIQNFVNYGITAGVAAVMLWCSQYVFFCAVMAVMISQPLLVNWANNLHRKRQEQGFVERTDIFAVVDRPVLTEWFKRSIFFSTYICIAPLMRVLVAAMPIAAVARIPLMMTIAMQGWMTHYARENITRKNNSLDSDGSWGFTKRMAACMFVMPLLQTIALAAKELELTASIVAYVPFFPWLTGSFAFYAGISLAFYGAVNLIQSSVYTAAFYGKERDLDPELAIKIESLNVSSEEKNEYRRILQKAPEADALRIKFMVNGNPLTAQAINGLVSKSKARDAERAAEHAKKEQPGFFTGIMQSFGLWKKADEAKMAATKGSILSDKKDALAVVEGIEKAANIKKAA
jgi:hypothetical protein